MKPCYSRNGFTLLELSVVLVIIALVIGGGLATLTGSIQANRYNATVAQMDALEKALLQYSVAFGRLPCPASLTLPPSDANYGIEAANTGTCVGGTPAATSQSASGTVEGAVPTRTLRLPDSFMYDGWGHRLRYAVDPTMTTTGAVPVYAGCGFSSVNSGATTSAITIKDASGSTRSAAASYALISHGANGHGAYTSNGVVVNAGSQNADEQTNCHCNSSATATTYTGTYIAKLPVVDPVTATSNFDDLVTFKENWQLQTPNVPLGPASSCGSTFYIADNGNNHVRKVASTGIITTFAGTGSMPYSGDGGPATSAGMNPQGLAVDSSGNVYICDTNNNRIRKVASATGIITTVAGNGMSTYSGDGGAATSAALNDPQGVALDAAGNIYITDTYNNRIRKVTTSTGIITTIAGSGSFGYSGDGGAATSAKLENPVGLALDSSGNFYFADNSSAVREVNVSTGIITTIAGGAMGGYSGDGGLATSAKLMVPTGVAADSSGNIYIADTNNQRIRKVTASTGIITTVAGNGTQGYTGDGGAATSAELAFPGDVGLDSSGNLYIADGNNHRIRSVTVSTGIITTVAGNGTSGYTGDGGSATSAELGTATGVAISR